ncbi:unnamed protein product [Lymnaea stagnalis]|uniref:Leucine-rich repeat-containing protein 27 n=1 Tax=Lymnaea stagnalis TaxID=6523 RepID=A0AAV2IJV4_LYMST
MDSHEEYKINSSPPLTNVSVSPRSHRLQDFADESMDVVTVFSVKNAEANSNCINESHSYNNNVYSDDINEVRDAIECDGVISKLMMSNRDACETPADFLFVKTKKEQDDILKCIEKAKTMQSTTIDLSRKKLQAIPDNLLELTCLEYLYLQGNEIAYLPDNFFKCFPSLLWLDLRNNALSRIPSAYLSNHTCLRNLLLEGNNLRNLPLELGLVKSLHGLNIAGNPLDFPPQSIMETGTQAILQFLRDVLNAKNSAKIADLDLSLSKGEELLEQVSASSDDWNTTASMMELAKMREMAKGGEKDLSQDNVDYSDKQGLRPNFIHQDKVQSIKKNKKVADLGAFEEIKKIKENKMSWKVNPYPTPPTQEYVKFKMNEEKQMARVKEFREKTDAILQRRKDEAMLKNWRDDTKALQQKKYSQHLVPGEDYKEIAEQAPFDVDKDMMQVLTKEERLKADLQKEKKMKQERSVSPATRQRIELEKQTRIRELEKRIKDHTAGMVERRKQPRGTPQHEMEIAKRELEMVKNLQRDLMRRYQELKAWSAARAKRARENFSRPTSAGFRY